MSGVEAWGRLGLGTAVSAALLVALSPARPSLRLDLPLAALAGAVAGVTLYLAVARRRPLRPAGLTKAGLLALAATNEEVVWRRVVLGELLRAGSLAAFAGSTLGFALVHRARVGLHFATGATFGCLYLVTGALAAPIAAHWMYNLLLLGLSEQTPPRDGAPP
jgi:membrane protease YdiL (CAAX protease family)